MRGAAQERRGAKTRVAPVAMFLQRVSGVGPTVISVGRALERFPIAGTHAIDKKSLQVKKLEQVRIEKGGQLF